MIKVNLQNILALFTALFFSSCVTRSKGLIFSPEHKLALDVYSPKKIRSKTDVLVFIHGGNWRSGKRKTYKFFGKGFARKGVVTVVIDYRLSAVTDFRGMGTDAAKAVKWVQQNISNYGGDSSRIFLSGHSSGGHLSALVATDNAYFKAEGIENTLKGVVLIDAFGLDMYSYLKKSQNAEDSIYFPAFTKDPVNWKKGSPIYFVDKKSPLFLTYVGERTYPAIKKYSGTFLEALKPFQPQAQLLLIKGKKHVPMIAQFYNPSNRRYDEILEFMKKVK
ncbi:esterase [Sphingobacteriaceae bacterium]|nr:esterase [Sphingobacteriaceae bacterium]